MGGLIHIAAAGGFQSALTLHSLFHDLIDFGQFCRRFLPGIFYKGKQEVIAEPAPKPTVKDVVPHLIIKHNHSGLGGKLQRRIGQAAVFLFQGIGKTALLFDLGALVLKGHIQHGEECKIVVEGKTGKIPKAVAQLLAQPAIDGLIKLKFFDFQLWLTGPDISKQNRTVSRPSQ